MPQIGLFATLDCTYNTDFYISCHDKDTELNGMSVKFHVENTWSNCYGELSGTWRGSLTSSSDRNLKHDIEQLSSKYDVFFDNLIPCRFKLNNGNSGRYHTGFIAQEVEEAILKAGLSTQEAALFVRFLEQENKQSEEKTTYGLRYEEFIALCVDQIQKLKARVALLESEKGGM